MASLLKGQVAVVITTREYGVEIRTFVTQDGDPSVSALCGAKPPVPCNGRVLPDVWDGVISGLSRAFRDIRWTPPASSKVVSDQS